MNIKSNLARHKGWELEVPNTTAQASETAGWTFKGGGTAEILDAPDWQDSKETRPGHLSVVTFTDTYTIAKYNGGDGQPLTRYEGPSAMPTR